MREIKFRAWNKNMNQMVYPTLKFGRDIWPCSFQRITTTDYEKKVITITEEVSIDHILQEKETFEVMQFTGEIDRDKTEIYEGDLVKLGAEKEVYRVKFHAGCFMLYNKDKQIGLLGELKMCFIKVIGNVFDNPELL